MRDFELDPYEAELVELQRRRNMAQAQIAQGMDTSPIRHWSQGAARVLASILGNREAERVSAEMRGVTERRQADQAAEMGHVSDLLTGANGPPQDRAALARAMMGMKNPQFQRLGMQMAMQKAPEEEAYTLKPGEVRFRGGQKVAEVPAAAPVAKPELPPEAIRLARIANNPDVPEFERQTARALLDRMTREPQGPRDTPYYSPVATTEGVMAFNHRTGGVGPVAGGSIVRAADDPATQARLRGAREYGGQGAKANMEQADSAMKAAESLAKIDQTLGLLKSSDAITGMGAEVMLNVERARSQFLNSEKAGKRVSDSQLLDSLLGQEVFPMIGALGIGARGMDTPAEREFLRQTMTGTRPMDRDTLIRLTEIRRNIQQRVLDRWNERVRRGELDDFFTYTGRAKGEIMPAGGRAAPQPAAGRQFRVLGPE